MFIGKDGTNHIVTFVLISILFFLWGTCNGMIDVMDKHFQDLLHLSKAQSAWIQFAHYSGYFLMALPASWLASKFGYKSGIIIGLLLVSLGGFWFIPATSIAAFWSFLLGVCLISMGLTILETVANPYTTVLGPKEYAAFRINFAQSFNGVGWILGPIIGGAFFYSEHGAQFAHQQLYIPYLVVAVVVIVLAVVFCFSHVPDLNTEDEYNLDDKDIVQTKKTIWAYPHFVGAVIAQFFYVAAQAGIFSFFINYVIEEFPSISKQLADNWLLNERVFIKEENYFFNEKGATFLLGTIGFPLFLLGRAIGALIMKRLKSYKVLGSYALINTLICGLIVLNLGWTSVIAVFLSFFFMSIMFPTIFALGIYGLGSKAKKASGFIVMAIMGGAIMPKLMGHLGDKYNMSVGFLMPMICFSIISIYGFAWYRFSKQTYN
ncbi:MAG: L-fucose:H+ symporter permease [Bacteroidota bacterium]